MMEFLGAIFAINQVLTSAVLTLEDKEKKWSTKIYVMLGTSQRQDQGKVACWCLPIGLFALIAGGMDRPSPRF